MTHGCINAQGVYDAETQSVSEWKYGTRQSGYGAGASAGGSGGCGFVMPNYPNGGTASGTAGGIGAPETVAIDAEYKTPWICKKIIGDRKNSSMPYKRPMEKDGFFRPHEYIYDEHHDCVICPQNQILKYSTTNRNGYREFKSNIKICANCHCLSQ